MNIKSKKKIIAGLFLLVCILAFVAISAARTPTALYADSANPFLQVTCGSENKSGTGWTWETDESYNGTLTLNGYDGEEISIGGVDNGKVNIVLVGENKITVTAPYGNQAIRVYNVSTLTFKGNGSLTIDFQYTATKQTYMYGIYMDGDASSNNNGNLMFDESCTVTVKVYGEVAEKNGSVNAIFIRDDRTSSGNVTVGENATLNIDLKCDKPYQTYGIYAKGSIVLNGTVDIKMEYTGSGSVDSWRDVYTPSSYTTCSIGKNAKITSVCPGSSGSILVAFPLVANGAQKISSWTCIASSEQYFENDDCLVHVWNKAADNISFKNYSYTKLATPLTFEDKAEYDVPATVYGDNAGAYSSIALSASGGSGEYTFSVVSAADGNTSGVGVSSNESDLNKIYVAPNLRGVSEATEITVKVTDKCGYSKTITVNIGAVAAPTYSATVDPVDFGTVRVGYGTQDAVYVTVKNTGTGKIFTNGASVTLEGENASDYFTLQCGSVPTLVYAGSTMTNWWIKPNSGLPVGTYIATIKFSGTPEYSQYGGSSVQATATVSFVVTEHDFDTSVWESDGKKHWNPCKDTGCAVRGNEAAHDKDGELTGYAAADFNNDGNTGTKHCSVCGAVSEVGAVIPAGKYIRVSQATMEPAAITNEMAASDLTFTSGDSSKYTVSLYNWRVYDLTDTSLNTDDGKYPKGSKFVAGHEYAIEIAFKEVGSYVYNETSADYMSTFTVNGKSTQNSEASSLSGSKYRRITLEAKDATIPVTITEVQISFSGVNVKRGNNYSFTATVSGTGAFDNSVTWSVTGGSAGTTVSGDGVLTVAANESAATLTVKAVANGDSGKYATITVTIVSLITVNQNSGNQQYTVAAGVTINLTAETAASGYHFKEWQVSGAGTFTDKNAKETVFTVPCENVTVTSVYELHSASGETWQTNGTSHWHLCSCGEKVNVAPHNPDRAAATETEPVKCTECGYVITPALGHTEHTAGEVWLSDGTNHWHVCTGCSQKLDISEHTYGAWTVIVQPQVGVAGEKERECSVCGYKDIAPVDALAEQITVTVVGGKINGNASVTVDKNESVTVVADEAPAGKTFKGWSADGGQTIISESASYTFNATENVTLTAVYADVNAGGENTGEQGGEQSEKTESSGCGSAVTFGSWILPVILTLLGGIAALLYNRRRAKTRR